MFNFAKGISWREVGDLKITAFNFSAWQHLFLSTILLREIWIFYDDWSRHHFWSRSSISHARGGQNPRLYFWTLRSICEEKKRNLCRLHFTMKCRHRFSFSPASSIAWLLFIYSLLALFFSCSCWRVVIIVCKQENGFLGQFLLVVSHFVPPLLLAVCMTTTHWMYIVIRAQVISYIKCTA